jgi:hypothetical protein
MYERYQRSCVRFQGISDLNLILKKRGEWTYIDKLWVEDKGKGKGTRYFQEYLRECAANKTMLLWRTITDRKKEWYLKFDGVNHIATYNGYYYFTYNKSSARYWTYEDIDMFKEQSMFI